MSNAVKEWDTLSADEKRLHAREMEVFAGFGAHVDYEAGDGSRRFTGKIRKVTVEVR